MRIGARRTKGERERGRAQREAGGRRKRSIDTFELWRQFWRSHPRRREGGNGLVGRPVGKRKRIQETAAATTTRQASRSKPQTLCEIAPSETFPDGVHGDGREGGEGDGPTGRTYGKRVDATAACPPTAKVFRRHSNQLLVESHSRVGRTTGSTNMPTAVTLTLVEADENVIEWLKERLRR